MNHRKPCPQPIPCLPENRCRLCREREQARSYHARKQGKIAEAAPKPERAEPRDFSDFTSAKGNAYFASQVDPTYYTGLRLRNRSALGG